jgi:hypothetical protein
MRFCKERRFKEVASQARERGRCGALTRRRREHMFFIL